MVIPAIALRSSAFLIVAFHNFCAGHQVLENYIRQFEMSVDQPWLLQQFLKGPEYSSYTIADNGRMVAHCDNVACLSCLQYKHVDIPEVTICLSSLQLFVFTSHNSKLPVSMILQILTLREVIFMSFSSRLPIVGSNHAELTHHEGR